MVIARVASVCLSTVLLIGSAGCPERPGREPEPTAEDKAQDKAGDHKVEEADESATPQGPGNPTPAQAN